MAEQRAPGLATHDPHKLNSSLEGQITELVCFYLQDDKQLEYVERFGLNRDEVQSLPNGRSLIEIHGRGAS